MTSNFPSSLDDFSNPTAADSLNTANVIHSDQHSNGNDAIEAIEAWVGISGTSARASHEYRIKSLEGKPNPQELIGIMGWDEGQPLGTGTILNVVGAGANFSISGTVLNLSVQGGGSSFAGVDQIGIYAQDEGIPIGTGTVINVTGDNVQVSLSGTVLNLHHTNPAILFPQEVIGVVGWDEGIFLGTGTVLNVVGAGATLTISGSVLNLSVPDVAAQTVAAPVKTTLAGADKFPIVDSEDSDALKYLPYSDLNTILLNSYSVLFAPITKGVTNGDSHDHEGGDGGALAFLLPFATYVDLNPITATGKYPYAATVRASMTFIEWSQAVFTVGAAHDVSNYYTLTLKLRQTGGDVTIASINTQTLGTGIAGHKVLALTSFTTGSVTGTGYIYMEVTKTGTPSDLYIVCPSFRCR